jgi:hypothetical protein
MLLAMGNKPTYEINVPIIDTQGVGLEDPQGVAKGLGGLQGVRVKREELGQTFEDVGAQIGEAQFEVDGTPTDMFQIIPKGGGPTIAYAKITKK